MLAHLSDQDLVTRLKEKVKAERELLVDLLRDLEEVERRKLFLARGYSSLFAFCVGELGYSDGEAHSRIQTMRLSKAVPEVKSKLSNGELTLTVAARAQSCFARAAKADRPVARQEKLAILNDLSHTPTRRADQILASKFPEARLPHETVKPIGPDTTRVEFNLNALQLGKLERLKNLLAHKNFDGRLDRLFEIVADMALAKLEKDGRVAVPNSDLKPLSREKVCDAALLEAPQVKPRQSTKSPEAESAATQFRGARRYVSVHIKRQVWARDQGRCQYRDPLTGRRCESRHALELDHVRPFAQGGEGTAQNLRLLCAAHNKWRADAR